MKLLRIETPSELRRQAGLWDDLWWRSESYLPTQRAELLAQWLEYFARGRPFVALVVEADGQFVTALALVDKRKAGLVSVGALASNCWTEAGTLLFDASAPPSAMPMLLAGVRGLGWPLVCLDEIDRRARAWTTFMSTAVHSELAFNCTPQYHVGLIDITHDWDVYVAAWSRNHRSAIKRSLRKARKAGDLELRQFTEPKPHEIEPLFYQAFELEDKSWKGAASSSVFRTPGMFDFYVRQAQRLAAWGQLELLLLTLDGQPIAFEYCYFAKGVTASNKIGYDPDFRQHGPGRLLRYLQLQRYFADSQRKLFDTMGIMCASKARWCTRSTEVSRLILPTRVFGGRALYAGYANVWPYVRRMIKRSDPRYTMPKLGATDARPEQGPAESSVKFIESQG